MSTSNGAVALAGCPVEKSATVVDRLLKAGVVILGKANMAEWSDSGTESVSSLGGVVSNAFDQTRTPYGSSGGSAVAVAVNFCDASIGADTEGSVIGPASAAGIIGYRAAVDRFPTRGVTPAFQRMDVVGPMAKTMAEIALLTDIMAGDSDLSLSRSVHHGRGHGGHGRRVAVFRPLIEPLTLDIPQLGRVSFDVEDNVAEAFEQSLVSLRASGGETVDVELAAVQQIAMVILQLTVNKVQCSGARFETDMNAYLASTRPCGIDSVDTMLASDALAPAFQTSWTQKRDRSRSTTIEEGCSEFEANRQLLQTLVTQILDTTNTTLIVFPAFAQQPPLKGAARLDMPSTSIAPYLAWPSLVLPMVGDVGVGFVFLAPAHSESELFHVASAFEHQQGLI